MKLGIVILNYENYNDTFVCVDSLLNFIYLIDQIVIIDNNSSNESFKLIKDKYNNLEKIELIKSKENIGYSRGNNLGISFLEKKDIMNVLVLNNDTIITDSNYIRTLKELDLDSSTGAIGTKIIGRDGLNQNPIFKDIKFSYTIKDYLYLSFYSFFSKRKKTKNLTNKKPMVEQLEKNHDSYYLHGSAILLTKNYLKDFHGFFPYTFLYYEENILGYIFKRSGLKMQYINYIELLHKEDMSSDIAFSNPKKQKRIFMKQSLKYAILLRFIPLSIIKILFKRRIIKDWEENVE